MTLEIEIFCNIMDPPYNQNTGLGNKAKWHYEWIVPLSEAKVDLIWIIILYDSAN